MHREKTVATWATDLERRRGHVGRPPTCRKPSIPDAASRLAEQVLERQRENRCECGDQSPWQLKKSQINSLKKNRAKN